MMGRMKIPCGNGVVPLFFKTAVLGTNPTLTWSCRLVNSYHYSPFPKGIQILNLEILKS